MLGKGLVACRACNRHAFESEPLCPHCGASLRTGAGAVLRTAVALTMGLGVATFSGWACSAYGVGPSGNCENDDRCKACVACARDDGAGAVDAGRCSSKYDSCVGASGACEGDGEAPCCAFDACLDGCGSLDDAASWACVCGSTSPSTCAIESAPAGTCAGDHPEGAALALGPDGWLSCALRACDLSCP